MGVDDHSPTLEITDRSTLRRRRDRGSHDRAEAYAILDEGIVCHVAFVIDGEPCIVPMAYARIGDTLYLHGAVANRMLRHMATGAAVCVAVTLVDGLVLARAAFHHSMNYRSVVLYGVGARTQDVDEIDAATAALLEHMAPGRSAEARPPTDIERTATMFIRFPIEEGSVKIRRGPPIDDEEDLGLDVWAGVVPFAMVPGEGQRDELLSPDVATPPYVEAYPPRARSVDHSHRRDRLFDSTTR